MSAREIKSMYETLLSSGDLFDLYPDMHGNWDEDKKEFTKQFNFNQKLLEEEEEGEDFNFFGYDEIY